MTQTVSVQATTPAQRDLLPDIMRGAALWGILCVNMQDFAGYSEWQQTGPDRAAQVLIDLLLNGKAVSLFAMLFGMGAAALYQRGGTRLLTRRLWALLLLGLSHYIFLWHGDIIANYAVVGAGLLLALRLWPAASTEATQPYPLPHWRTAALWGSGCCLLWLLGIAQQALSWLGPNTPRSAEPVLTGTYRQLMQQRAAEALPYLAQVVAFDGLWLLGLFLLGVACQQLAIFKAPEHHRTLFGKLLALGLLVGVPLSVGLTYCNTQPTYLYAVLGMLCRFGGGLNLALGYAGIFGLLATADKLGPLRLLAAPGRLALSLYLMQSLCMTALFYPYGGALGKYVEAGHLGAAACLGIALVFGAVQVLLANVYLRHFQRGPAEWLLRRLVYGA